MPKKNNFPTLMTSRLRYEEQMVYLIDGSVCDFEVYNITSFLLIDKYLFWPRNCKKLEFPAPITSSEWIITCIIAFTHHKML